MLVSHPSHPAVAISGVFGSQDSIGVHRPNVVVQLFERRSGEDLGLVGGRRRARQGQVFRLGGIEAQSADQVLHLGGGLFAAGSETMAGEMPIARARVTTLSCGKSVRLQADVKMSETGDQADDCEVDDGTKGREEKKEGKEKGRRRKGEGK